MNLIKTFWLHVFQTPDQTAMKIKDPIEIPYGGTMLKDISWWAYGHAVAAFMVYLRKEGVQRGDRVAILGSNCPQWICADLAIQSLGAVTVPIYPNSSSEQLNYILENAEARLTICFDSKLSQKVQFGSTAKLEQILSVEDLMDLLTHPQFEGLWESQLQPIRQELSAIQTMAFSSGPFNGIQRDDLATIIYTSGSSGAPKGCMITHLNIATALSGLSDIVRLKPKTDFYLSYLPLAHIYEREGMYMCIKKGIPVAFSSVEQMQQNLGNFKPTMLCGVPAVWEKMRNGLYDPKELPLKILNKLGIWKRLLDFAVTRKSGSLLHRLFDKIIFSKVRARLGGRLRLLVSGGAPISKQVLQFFSAIGANVDDPKKSLEVLEGYGATETTGGITSNRPYHGSPLPEQFLNRPGTVGLPVDLAKLRIVKELGEEELDAGEVQIHSPQIFKGYWRMEEQTREAFTEDGYFRTGDLGVIDEDGFLTIKGRKNGMYKTSQGKYVSREKLELAFKAYPIIQYILPVAHGRKYTTALVWVNPDTAKTLVNRPVPENVDAYGFYCEQPEVQSAVAQAIEAGNQGLEHWEKVGDFRIIKVAATSANGIVTETLKLRSKVLLKKFEQEIDELYAHPSRDKKVGADGWFSRAVSHLQTRC